MTLGSLVAAGRRTIEEVLSSDKPEPEATSPKNVCRESTDIGNRSSEHFNGMTGNPNDPSSDKSKESVAPSEDTGYHTATEGNRSSETWENASQNPHKTATVRDVDGLHEGFSLATTDQTPSSPIIPPRPRHFRPGGLLSQRRAESSRNHGKDGNASIQQKLQTMSAPNMRVVLAPTAQNDDPEREPSGTIPSEWIDLDPGFAPASATPLRDEKAAPRYSVQSPSYFVSEASDDTVVDWSPNTTHRPVPTMTVSPAMSKQPTPTLKRSLARKPKKPASASLDLDHPARSDDTVVQWSTLKKSPRVFDIHKDLVDFNKAGATGAVEQTPPPDISLLSSNSSRLPIPKTPSALRETTGNSNQPSPSPSPRGAVKPRENGDLGEPHASHSSPTLGEASLPAGPRPLHVTQARPSPSQPPPAPPQTYTPSGAPQVGSPQTFIPPGPPPVSAPPLPPRTYATASSTTVSPMELLFVQWGDQLQHVLHKDLKTLKRDIQGEFERQRTWFETVISQRDHWTRRVMEENERLREELSRARVGRRR